MTPLHSRDVGSLQVTLIYAALQCYKHNIGIREKSLNEE